MKFSKSIPLIIDTDLGSDSDDVGALMVAHRLQQKGQCKLLAITSSTSRRDSVAAIDIVNRFYGTELPTGNVKNKIMCEESVHGKYSRAMAFAYGSRYLQEEPEDAVRVMRRILAQTEERVRLVAIGPLVNVAQLLKSEADEFSALTGTQLVREKVLDLYAMAGNFHGIINFYDYEFEAENNVALSVEDSIYVAEHFPRPIVYSPFELGAQILTGERLLTGKDNPMKMAYYVFQPAPRESWDPLTVYMAVMGLDAFTVYTNVTVRIDTRGVTFFTEGGKDKIVTGFRNKEQLHLELEELISVS